MVTLFAKQALLPDGWAQDVRLRIDGKRIGMIEPATQAHSGDLIYDAIVPGMPNLHSHAFQRGMAGLAERRGASHDTFWTWREVMYRFAHTLSPAQMQRVAVRAYVDILESGFTRVGEFHYLHHDRDGRPYADIGEMAGMIASAAQDTGINLTLLPVFYAHATFGGAAPTDGQRRFISSLDQFARLVERCQEMTAHLDESLVGVAPHSLRAVTPAELGEVAQLLPNAPIHIHAAEQVLEVEDCLAWSGQRPVEWLLNHAGIDRRWCLIHATHLTSAETADLAASGAVAGLCPVTEANLGDGHFPGSDFINHRGAYGIGTDSNVQIGVAAELRQLEYAQRLRDRARNVMVTKPGSTGRALLDGARDGGARALGAQPPRLSMGASAEFVALDLSDAPAAVGDQVIDSWVFTNGVTVDSVWARGRQLVRQGRHIDRERLLTGYHEVIEDIMRS